MSGDSRSYALNISEHLFRLTTESLRLHSNETRRYQTLASLVNSRTAEIPGPREHETDIIRKHLVAIPTKGNIRIYLNISKTSADSLAEAKRRLGKQLGSSMTMGDALSVLLFDYVVELKATRFLQRVGLDEASEKRDEQDAGSSSSGKVIPFK